MKIHEERNDDSCLYVNPNTEFNHLPSDVTTIIMRNLPVEALLTLRHVDTYLAGHITFYQFFLRLDELKNDPCKTLSFSDRCKNLFWGFQKQPSVEDKKIHYIDMIKRGLLTVGGIHSSKLDDITERCVVGAFIDSQSPVIHISELFFSKKGNVSWFAEKLSFNDYVKDIKFDIGEMSEQDEETLGIIVQKCANLKYFWIRHSFEHYEASDRRKKGQISDRGAKAIAKGVASHKNIEWLEIVDTNIGNLGAFALAAALKRNESLHVLSLCGNKIGREGAEALIAAGEKHKNLTNLEMLLNWDLDTSEFVNIHKRFKS